MENYSSFDDAAHSPPLLSPSHDDIHPKNCSKDEMVFDYFDTSAPKLRPQTSTEMTTFKNYRQQQKVGNNFSSRSDDPFENGTDDRRLLQNGSKNDHHHHHHHHRMQLYDDDDDDDELQQVVIDDSNRKYLSTHHDQVIHPFRSNQRSTAGPGDAITFFHNVPSTHLMSMETLSSSRSDILGELQSRSTKNFNISSSEGEELLPMDGLKVQTTLNSPFMSSVPSNCLTNLICSIKPNSSDRSEVEKRILRRDIRRENIRRKAPERKAEDIPEYKGKMSVDDIIAFIDDTKDKKANKQLKKDETRPMKKYLDHDVKIIPQDLEGHEVRVLSPPLKQCDNPSKMADQARKQEVVDVASLATSSSNSSFRTASPPVDIPPLEGVAPSPAIHKEFITVQKKKKLKQATANKYEMSFPSTFESHQPAAEQLLRLTSKPPFAGRQAALKTYSPGQPTNNKNYSDDNNNTKLISARIPFSEKVATPVDNFKEAQKLENQFDPSQFPELTSNARRNSTGSSAPKMDSKKDFVFSYADVAAKSRQKKHSSDKQRRSSLQLDREDAPFPTPDDKIFREDPLDPPQSLPVELDAMQFSEEVLEVSNPSCVDSTNFNSTEEGTSRVSNPLCKEPVVFLDGRMNAAVTDLVFIFDPTLPPNPPGRKFDPEHVVLVPSSEIVSRMEGEEPIIPSTNHFAADPTDDDNSTFIHQPAARPSPLSNHHSAARQVVKVSPMPIVTPEVSFVRSGEDSKPSVDLPSAIGKSLVDERTSKNHFDLCKAQMFLYAGFEECVKESKNNPNNVVVYRE